MFRSGGKSSDRTSYPPGVAVTPPSRFLPAPAQLPKSIDR